MLGAECQDRQLGYRLRPEHPRASRIAASICWILPTTSGRRRCAISAFDPTRPGTDLAARPGDLLMTIRPLVRKFHLVRMAQRARDLLEICFAAGFSGDVKQAQQLRGRSQERRPDRLFDPDRGGASSKSCDPARRAERGGSAEFIISGRRPRSLPAIRISSPKRQRQSREPEIHRQGNPGDRTIYPDVELTKKSMTVNAHDAQTVRLPPPVDPDQDRTVGRAGVPRGLRKLTASGGAATATDRDARGPRPRSHFRRWLAWCRRCRSCLRALRTGSIGSVTSTLQLAAGRPGAPCARHGSGSRGAGEEVAPAAAMRCRRDRRIMMSIPRRPGMDRPALAALLPRSSARQAVNGRVEARRHQRAGAQPGTSNRRYVRNRGGCWGWSETRRVQSTS